MKLLDCNKITKTTIHTIFNKADYYLHNDDKIHDECKGKILCNIFCESNSCFSYHGNNCIFIPIFIQNNRC